MMSHLHLSLGTLSFYLNLLFLCIGICNFSGCTNEGQDESAPFAGDAAGQFTEEKPYALMVAEARSIYHAENIARRLSKMNVPTEIIATEDDERVALRMHDERLARYWRRHGVRSEAHRLIEHKRGRARATHLVRGASRLYRACRHGGLIAIDADAVLLGGC